MKWTWGGYIIRRNGNRGSVKTKRELESGATENQGWETFADAGWSTPIEGKRGLGLAFYLCCSEH